MEKSANDGDTVCQKLGHRVHAEAVPESDVAPGRARPPPSSDDYDTGADPVAARHLDLLKTHNNWWYVVIQLV